MLGDIGRRLAAIGDDGSRWSKYRDDPIAFFDEVLGFRPWAKQAEIAIALRDGDLVTVVSANGVGKTKIAAACALWFWRTRDRGARVILTSATAMHVARALWGEVRELYFGAKRPLGGTIAQIASTGLRDDDGRELFGITAERPEAFQGIRARELMIVADESSGIADTIYMAAQANLSGGGKLLTIGNGMRSSGWFAETHKDESFARFQISALDSPNIKANAIVVPGLVNAAWVHARELEWGHSSPFWKIRVCGEFVSLVEGALFTPELIAESEQRWASTPPTGRLVIGVDCAGQSGHGDESVFVSRRGKRVIRIHPKRGVSPEHHVAIVRGMIVEDRGDSRDLPLVVLDQAGNVGATVFGAFTSALQATGGTEFQLEGVRGGERAKYKSSDIHQRRDELFFGLLDWMRDGGAIPCDTKLEAELSLIATDATVRGLSKVTPKDHLRGLLKRSPDRADALALSCVEVHNYAAYASADDAPTPTYNIYEARDELARSLDPYEAMKIWGGGGGPR